MVLLAEPCQNATESSVGNILDFWIYTEIYTKLDFCDKLVECELKSTVCMSLTEKLKTMLYQKRARYLPLPSFECPILHLIYL